MTKRIYKERRLYFAENCEKCGNQFQSFKRSKIKHGLCRKCRRLEVNKDQIGLFTEGDQKTIDEGGTVVKQFTDPQGDHHELNFKHGQIVEKINGVPRLVMGEIPEGI